MVKSGSDFRQFSKIVMRRDEFGDLEVKVKRVDIDHTYDEDKEVKAIVDEFSS